MVSRSGWRSPAGNRHPFRRGTSWGGRYCTLEPLDLQRHGRELFRAFSLDRDGRGWTYLPYGPFEDEAAYLEWIRQSSGSRDPAFFAIVDAALGAPTGVCAYLRIQPEHGSLEVGHLAYSPLLQKRTAATPRTCR